MGAAVEACRERAEAFLAGLGKLLLVGGALTLRRGVGAALELTVSNSVRRYGFPRTESFLIWLIHTGIRSGSI